MWKYTVFQAESTWKLVEIPNLRYIFWIGESASYPNSPETGTRPQSVASGESSFNSPHQDEEEIKISSPIKSDLLKVDENKPVSGKVSIAMNDLLESLLDHTNMDTKDEHLSDIPQTSTVTKKDDMNGNMFLNINICKRHINAPTIFFYAWKSICTKYNTV